MNDRCQSRIRVFSAIGAPLLRQGVASLVGGFQDMEWAGDAGDAPQVFEYCKCRSPGVALIDLQLRTLSGLALIRKIRREMPEIKLVALTAYNSEAQARAAVRAGAQGFLTKDATPDELVETIRTVHAGRTRLPAAVTQPLLWRPLSQNELSGREIEVLRLLAEFGPTKIVAAYMNISEGTVKVHVKHILEKMGARDRTHAVVTAIRLGLISV